jgi:hypothetical protein
MGQFKKVALIRKRASDNLKLIGTHVILIIFYSQLKFSAFVHFEAPQLFGTKAENHSKCLRSFL